MSDWIERLRELRDVSDTEGEWDSLNTMIIDAEKQAAEIERLRGEVAEMQVIQRGGRWYQQEETIERLRGALEKLSTLDPDPDRDKLWGFADDVHAIAKQALKENEGE